MAYYARDDFFHNPELLERSVEVLRGNLTLDWMDLDIEKVKCRPSDARRGLTFDDTNVGSYGWDEIPEKIRHNYSMAPRGAVQPPGLPNLGYDINRKSEVWADNAPALYEESKARHWIPTRKVPWDAVEQIAHSDELERGLAQLYTDLTSMATALGDIPSKWVWHINQELLELKMFQCAQMFDAAQLADVSRKRAIAGGTGLGRDHAPLGELLKCVLDSGTFPCASASGHILLAGFMQILLRHIGACSSNAADQTISCFGVQDVSRSIAYGMGHMHYLLGKRPHESTGLEGHVDEVENALVGYLASPILVSALALVTAGSREKAADAVPQVTALYRRFSDEHLERRNAAGIGSDSSPLQAFVSELEA
ncbi:MAG: hypothetical protein JRH16_17200 [Deltaproteobacteria bacterium]|nr:hypothetical protein [Deltaproteobacteria bacterium]MBW2418970.1 hypothetical protein [Deltaproteobacteria bacterium]